ncbi:MAG: hypothetical protein PF448_03485 [Bacteroidales bacterium]|jgi:hypothetical protein|nr:hypothetical protein [Bacteroidales bacterium]
MKTFFKILVLFAVLTLVACESQRHISVTVVDEYTGQALDSVFVQVMAGKDGNYDKNSDEGYTDEAGIYETYMMIGCTFGCYDIQMTYTKVGYEKLVQLNKTDGTISLKKD